MNNPNTETNNEKYVTNLKQYTQDLKPDVIYVICHGLRLISRDNFIQLNLITVYPVFVRSHLEKYFKSWFMLMDTI